MGVYAGNKYLILIILILIKIKIKHISIIMYADIIIVCTCIFPMGYNNLKYRIFILIILYH